MKRGAFLIILALLSIWAALMYSGMGTSPAASGFDMGGTITYVLTPASIVVGNITVDLAGINASGLSSSAYVYLMEDLRRYYTGKDVLVKGNYAYFDLNGSYNSESINEMIQRQISELEAVQGYITVQNHTHSHHHHPNHPHPNHPHPNRRIINQK
ncbi:hypothetical protein [Methanothrix sp.]|uniref:hypothetical protein n=2 Tax=Methanothrix sp. TaxID=90426 RepID=UPI001BD2F42B